MSAYPEFPTPPADDRPRAWEDTKNYNLRFVPSRFDKFAEQAIADGWPGPAALLRQLADDYVKGKRMADPT
jgi:hypothetical protein